MYMIQTVLQQSPLGVIPFIGLTKPRQFVFGCLLALVNLSKSMYCDHMNTRYVGFHGTGEHSDGSAQSPCSGHHSDLV